MARWGIDGQGQVWLACRKCQGQHGAVEVCEHAIAAEGAAARDTVDNWQDKLGGAWAEVYGRTMDYYVADYCRTLDARARQGAAA